MMKLSICHLFPRLLNLQGDSGNTAILARRCEKRGIAVSVEQHNGGKADFSAHDMIFIGSGQDCDLAAVLEHLQRSKKQLESFIENGGVVLAVSGGYQMLGEYIQFDQSKKLKCLGLLDFHTICCQPRLVGRIVIETELGTLTGFENHSGRTYTKSLPPLGKVVHGSGNNGEDGTEGVKYKNLFASYIHGPLLARAPGLADALLQSALAQKHGKVSLPSLDDEFEQKANQSILTELGL